MDKMFVKFIWKNKLVRVARKYWGQEKEGRGIFLVKQNKVLIIKLL